MSEIDKKIDHLSEVLSSFIEQQQSFNTRIEEKIDGIDTKVDKVQYFLEESIANNAKMFFEEQTKQASRIRELDNEVTNLKSNLYEMSLQIQALQKN